MWDREMGTSEQHICGNTNPRNEDLGDHKCVVSEEMCRDGGTKWSEAELGTENLHIRGRITHKDVSEANNLCVMRTREHKSVSIGGEYGAKRNMSPQRDTDLCDTGTQILVAQKNERSEYSVH